MAVAFLAEASASVSDFDVILKFLTPLGVGGLLAYVMFATVSIGWASDTDVTMTALRTLAQLFLLYVMAANVLDDWSRIGRALDVLLLATTVLAVMILAQAAGGAGRAVLRYGEYEVNPNFLAAQLAVPAAAALAFRARHAPLGWWRVVAVVPIVLALVGTLIVLTQGTAVAPFIYTLF